MRDLHVNWAWFVIFANAVAGVWSLVAHKVPGVRVKALWWFTAVAELTVFVQVCFGVWLVAKEKFVAPEFHMFYGFVAIIAVAILYSYRHQMAHQIYLLYGFGGLFLMGLGIRALLVGQG